MYIVFASENFGETLSKVEVAVVQEGRGGGGVLALPEHGTARETAAPSGLALGPDVESGDQMFVDRVASFRRF